MAEGGGVATHAGEHLVVVVAKNAGGVPTVIVVSRITGKACSIGAAGAVRIVRFAWRASVIGSNEVEPDDAGGTVGGSSTGGAVVGADRASVVGGDEVVPDDAVVAGGATHIAGQAGRYAEVAVPSGIAKHSYLAVHAISGVVALVAVSEGNRAKGAGCSV